MKVFTLFLLIHLRMSSNSIDITTPSAPKEILPPKPVVVLPLIVKKWPKRNRVAIYHSGPDFSPHGFMNPPFYPSPLTYSGAPFNSKLAEPPKMAKMRKLFHKIYFDEV